MLFTSYTFAIFVVGAFAAYWVAGGLSRSPRPQNLVLLLLSYGFYALFDWRWCLLLAGVTASGLVAGRLLEQEGVRRGLILGVVVAVDLLVLGIFKYLGFFAEAVTSVLGALGVQADQVTLSLVLPVGISYYIFQNLSYVIDVYRREASGRVDLLQYAVALSFFPQLLSGPITRPRHLLPQLAERRLFADGRARDGLRQILWGLLKKMVLADTIALHVDKAWADVGALDGLALLMVAVLYAFQIYCDFSGYADIAIGTAKLFNLELSPNFQHPYLATSVQDFWRRWHMTLSSWMRDYVYIPLGGSRRSPLRRVLNVLITFLSVGLWHGANLTFLVWGLLHGVYLALENLTRRRRGSREPKAAGLPGRVFSWLVVFALVTFAWVFFRAPSLDAAGAYLLQAVSSPFLATVEHTPYLPLLAAGAALLALEALTPTWEHGLSIGWLPLPFRWGIYLAACIALLLLAQFGGAQGIYVQF